MRPIKKHQIWDQIFLIHKKIGNLEAFQNVLAVVTSSILEVWHWSLDSKNLPSIPFKNMTFETQMASIEKYWSQTDSK